ncbi:extracellular solute-binding protein [Verminephrobacter aporrectodeae subsp. tuberculatae]|uniref:sugar ABC transporter substrate-binding protein n=1 Tax=Verminephrobacter aporrectodeae TaxID=1110389 RepID=UPI0022370697|nr:extracellular solute-binding protein [Verminephrobacter aporrectodeae]MCW5221379.1 extracellular solute-binding protein [Verminephrobacter aporrectodeae subsp. tuberculatae]MCW5290670.1 extracellular solute-binding protein [Verminephrobacter aporrectodeae subsp. tuberculatae]
MLKTKAKISATALVFAVAIMACSRDANENGAGNPGGTGKAATGSVLSILDYYNNEPEKGYIQAALDNCAAELGVSLDREAVPGGSLIQKVLQKASAKTLPDVLMLDNPEVQQIAESGALAPLSDFNVPTTGYAEGILSAGTYDGKVYGLAPTVNTLALFYNKKILSTAGIAPPTTWAELRDSARKLTTADTYGLAFAAPATYEGSWQFLPFMWSNGGDESDLSSPKVSEALQLLIDLVSSGSASRSVVNWSQGDVNDQFIAGKAAMMVNGPWNMPKLNQSTGLDYGIVQIPVNTAGQTPIAPLGGEIWTVPRTGNKAKMELAARFVACINSDKNQLALAEQRLTVPTKTALVPQFVAKVPAMKVFAEQIASARSRTGKLGAKWPDSATVIYSAVQLGLTGKASSADAFKQAAAK